MTTWNFPNRVALILVDLGSVRAPSPKFLYFHTVLERIWSKNNGMTCWATRSNCMKHLNKFCHTILLRDTGKYYFKLIRRCEEYTGGSRQKHPGSVISPVLTDSFQYHSVWGKRRQTYGDGTSFSKIVICRAEHPGSATVVVYADWKIADRNFSTALIRSHWPGG